MTMRRRSRRSFTRKPREKTTWDQTTAGFTMVAAVAQSVIDLTPLSITSLGFAGNSGGTIKRMIGDLRFETTGAGPDHVDVDIGIVVVTADALAAGAVPDPVSDFTTDWYFWKHLDQHLPSNNAESFNQGVIEWDIRTARKLRGGYRLALVIDKGASIFVLNFSFGMRGLWTIKA